MRASPCTSDATVTLGELAEAFLDAARETLENPMEADLAGAAAFWEFLRRAKPPRLRDVPHARSSLRRRPVPLDRPAERRREQWGAP